MSKVSEALTLLLSINYITIILIPISLALCVPLSPPSAATTNQSGSDALVEVNGTLSPSVVSLTRAASELTYFRPYLGIS